jgi:hypothetical protein
MYCALLVKSAGVTAVTDCLASSISVADAKVIDWLDEFTAVCHPMRHRYFDQLW